jgi:hypothetical protein
MSDPKDLIVKLTSDTSQRGGPDIIRTALGKGRVKQATPVFPGESDPELATIFNVSLAENASIEEAISALKRDRHVQYAHAPKERKPM